MPTFEDSLAAAQTRWDVAVLALRTWNERPPNVAPIREDDSFLLLFDEIREHFERSPDQLDLTDADRRLILEWTSMGTDAHGVDAIGFGLGLASSGGFAQCWRDQLQSCRYRPAVGDIYPVPDAPWPKVAGSGRRTPSPRSMRVDPDDHPFVRVHRDSPVAVEFDVGLWRPLRDLAENLDVVAAATVNETLDEFDLDPSAPIAFPVEPRDPAAQLTRILEQLEVAISVDARIIVFPELSTSAAIAQRIRERLGEDGEQRLVVCGSWHDLEPTTSEPRNVSVGVVSGVQRELRHRKIVEFGDLYPRNPKRRVREGISAPRPPVLRVYVADAFRFALVICKDFLDAAITTALDRVGANVLLIPSFSRTTQPFAARAAAHVADAQAVSIFANGPRMWESAVPIPTASLARPYEPNERLDASASSAPSLALFSLRDGTADIV